MHKTVCSGIELNITFGGANRREIPNDGGKNEFI